LRNETHRFRHWVDGFRRAQPILRAEKIFQYCHAGNQSQDIGEGKTGTAFDNMAPFQVGLDAIGMDRIILVPSNRSSDD